MPDTETTDIICLIDYTLLKPEATTVQIEEFCAEAKQHGFAAVYVHPAHISLAVQLLQDSEVKVGSMAGFPFGATLPHIKVFETEQVFAQGATEVDMVINVGALKDGRLDLVEQDMVGVAQAAHQRGGICKAIIETALLTEEEKVLACQLAEKAGVDFVKTCTGFNGGSATVSDVALMRRTVGPNVAVKAAGGIRTLTDAQKMVAAGATRLGTSAGVQIAQEAQGL